MNDGKICLPALNGTKVGNELVFPSRDLNIIYAVNIDDNSVRVWSSLPNENMFTQDLYGNILSCERGILLIPLSAKKIWFYENKNEKWISIECKLYKASLEFKFYGVVEWENYVYLLGFYFPGILKINLDDYTIKEISFSEWLKDKDYRSLGFLNWDYVIKRNFLYLPVLCSNTILKINLNTDEIEYIELGASDNIYIGLAYDGQKFWIAPRKGNAYWCWDEEKNIFNTYRLPDEYVTDGYCYGGIFINDNDVYFTSFVNRSVLFNKNNPTEYKLLNRTLMFHKEIDKLGTITQDNQGVISIFSFGEETKISYFIEKNKLETVYESNDIKKNAIGCSVIKESMSFGISDLLKII